MAYWGSGIIILGIVAINLFYLVDILFYLYDKRMDLAWLSSVGVIDFNVKAVPVMGVCMLILGLIQWLT